MVNPKTTKTKKRVDFLAFMDEVLRDMPEKNAKNQEVNYQFLIENGSVSNLVFN